MSASQFDPDILQDFLTESGELLEQLDQDLVTLESSADDMELINQVFRALHTIKGSASFLALTPLVEIAHAAETALNAARNGAFTVDQRAMDLLLRAVDVIRGQFEDLSSGAEMRSAEAGLAESLTALAEGVPAPAVVKAGASAAEDPADAAPATPEPTPQAPPASQDGGPRPLELDASKLDLLEFLVSDLDETMGTISAVVDRLAAEAERESALDELVDLADSLERSVEFFSFEDMSRLARALGDAGRRGDAASPERFGDVLESVRGVISALGEQCRGLEQKQAVPTPVDELISRLDKALTADSDTAPVAASAPEAEAPPADPEPDGPSAGSEAPPAAASPATANASASRGAPPSEQTIRVEVSRLESLLNLVGELVLQKNRVSALSREVLSTCPLPQELRDSLEASSGGLDRVTGDIQLAVMRTRMQPLDKLFQRYPRLIRDLARKLGKQIRLEIIGGETEVDKSVIEELGDPLVHLIRNACDHGIEPPAQRTDGGKDATGTVRLCAAHEGSHVRVQIIDDGRGLRRETIAAKAIERGLATEAEIAHMSDRDVFGFIFAAGFSTAEQVSDVSGRGVGMDVVRTNIEKLKGSIELDSRAGEGTTLSIKIPLTLSIMSAMMVEIAEERYAIPLTNILEIVRPAPEQLSTIRSTPVMRLRNSVLPLLDAQGIFGVPPASRRDAPFVVVLSDNGRSAGLLVSGLIGQQEIVIKPLDETVDHRGPLSGATVRADGGVSLIIDVSRLVRMTEANRKQESELSSSPGVRTPAGKQ